MDSQFSKHRENGRWLQTIALQFDDGELGKRTFHTCGKILKREVGIDGEPLGHRLVHQRNAMETVLYLLLQQLWVDVQYLLQEILSRGIICRNTALIGLAMIVLGLYFQETQLAVYIRAHTHLLSARMSVMMGVVEGVIFRIVIDGGVTHVALAVYLLHPILIASHLQELHQLIDGSNKFGVGPIHQFDSTHLAERDGLELRN